MNLWTSGPGPPVGLKLKPLFFLLVFASQDRNGNQLQERLLNQVSQTYTPPRGGSHLACSASSSCESEPVKKHLDEMVSVSQEVCQRLVNLSRQLHALQVRLQRSARLTILLSSRLTD